MTLVLECIPIETNALSLRKYCITIKNSLKFQNSLLEIF